MSVTEFQIWVKNSYNIRREFLLISIMVLLMHQKTARVTVSLSR